MNHYIKSIVEGFDFNNIDNSSKNKNLAKSAINLIIKKYSDDIKNKILNHVKLNSEEMQLLDTYAPEFRKQMKIKIDELLPLIIYHLVDNKANNLDWLDIDKFCEDNKIGMSPQEKFMLMYVPTKRDISKIKQFLQTIQELESHRDKNLLIEDAFPFLTLWLNPLDEEGEIITTYLWEYAYDKFTEKLKEVETTWFDGTYTATEFLENEYLLCLLIKQLSLINNRKLFITNNSGKVTHNIITIGYHFYEHDNTNNLYNVINKMSKIDYINKIFDIEIDNYGLCFIWIKKFKNLNDALNKLIIFGEEYVKQFNIYIKETEDQDDKL